MSPSSTKYIKHEVTSSSYPILMLSSSTIDKKLENFEFKFEFKVAINFEFVFEIFVNSQLRRSSRASAARSGSKGTL